MNRRIREPILLESCLPGMRRIQLSGAIKGGGGGWISDQIFTATGRCVVLVEFHLLSAIMDGGALGDRN